MRRRTLLFTLLVCGILLASAAFAQYRARLGDPNPVAIDLPLGQNVELVFRGDAAGAAIPGELHLNRLPQQRGTITRVTDEWLVLHSGSDEYWIPRNVILLIKVK
jgi:hypothetical protein